MQLRLFSVPGASQYRSLFQNDHNGLIHVFHALGQRYALCGRLTASQLRTRVDGVIAAWQDAELFPAEYLDNLQKSFINGSKISSSAVNDLNSAKDDDKDPVPMMWTDPCELDLDSPKSS